MECKKLQNPKAGLNSQESTVEKKKNLRTVHNHLTFTYENYIYKNYF